MIDEETRRKLREMGMGEMVEALVCLAKQLSIIWHAGIRHFDSEHADHSQCLFLSCFGNDKKGWKGA